MTPAQITRAVCMRRYAWGKSPQQIADESGLPVARINDVLAGRRFSEAVGARLVGYITTPAGPAALVQDNDRNKRITSERFIVLRRIMRLARLGRRLGFHARTLRTKSMTEGEMRAYAYSVDGCIKQILMKKHRATFERYKFSDSAMAWEWLERIDRLNAEPRTVADPR